MKNKVWIILLLMILLSSVFMGCMLPPAHTHSYSEWTVVKEATCTEAGLQEQVCSCGDKVSAPISATGHTVGEWIVDSELSCTTDLVKNQLCTVCGEIVNTESTQATGHTFTDWSTVTESTCTQNGQQQRVCTVCGEIETKDIELLEHSFGEWTVVEQPTCTQQGLEERACVCGEKETRDIELKPHSEGQWITDSQPNCTQDGSKHQVCAVCGSTIKTESIDALGHNYTSVVTPPTCEEQGYTTHTCSVCSDSYIDTYVDATDHTEGEWIVDIEPDCTTEGSKHQVCSICGDTIKTEPIDATGHSHEAVVTDPTCLEQGYTTHTCHCGDSYVDTYVDALGHNFQESDTCSICGQNIADAAVVTIDMSATADDNVTGYVVSRMDDKYDAYIKGVGAMKDYSDSPFAIDGYAIVDAYIDSGVTSIGAFAFYECFNLAEISFPNSVTSVGMFAFSNCGQLTSIVIPQSLISIEYYAFHGSGLSNITIEGTPQIGSFAFTYTPYYTDASNWQDDVLYVGHCLIAAKTTIDVCTIRQGTTVIADDAFRSCANIQSITIPSSITKVSNWAFGSCSNLTSVTIPNSVTSIGAFAFYECSNLTGITIPESVTSIGDEAFRYCTGLTSITIPSNVTSIGFAAFDGCTSLTTVYYSGTEEQWNSISIDIGTGCLTNANIVFNHPDHNYIAVVTAPTCTEQGYTTHTCHCGDSFVDTYVDALGHTISSWDIVDESVSVEDRLFAGTCEICQSVEEISLQQRFAQLEYVSFGDSITYGIDGVDWGLMEDPYPELVSNALGFKSFSNLAVSGATFCQNTLNRTNMTQKILSFTGKADIISLMLGVNDCYVGLPLGTSESRDNTTIYGSLFLISEHLTNNYSDSFVFYMTPFPAKSCYEDNSAGYNLEDVANAIKHVAALYDIPVLDMFLYSEYENVEMNNSNGDGLHPSQSFMRDYAAPKIISFIKDNYGVNYIHSHTIEVDQEIAPTCTNTGLTEGSHCSVCQEILVPQSIIDALGHDEIEHEAKAPTCTEIGWNAYVTCSRCDNTTYEGIPATGHAYTSVVTPPTCVEQGYTTHTCYCGYSFVDTYIDKLGHTYVDEVCLICGVDYYSEGLEYTLSGSEYIVSGIGSCTDTDIVIPSIHKEKPVTSIGEAAFGQNYNIRSVIIPNSVTVVGQNAFVQCERLTSVTIPSSITSLSRQMFCYCSNLKNITIPDSVMVIEDRAFYGCSALATITIPSSVTSIGMYAFAQCKYLNTVSFEPESDLTSIGIGAFQKCTKLLGIKIPANVSTIGNNAFDHCTALSTVTFEAGSKLTNIGEYAFTYCTGLKKVKICDILSWCRIQFANVASNPLYYAEHLYMNDKELTELVIPEGVESIGKFVFYNCKGLTSVKIPSSVKVIDRSFLSCTNLVKVEITDLTFWINIKFETMASSNPLYYAKHLYLNGEELTEIVLPEGIAVINDYVFAGGASFTSVIIPESVSDIGSATFSDCTSLSEVYYAGTEEQWNDISIGESNEYLTNANIVYNYTTAESN